ncbi:hypothetical protein CFC21_042118 [Triticum aestivum]|uniref:CASP-like protein n=2 Tax=Triticum aestivum TaxID=4565 RepID=A0A9R1JUZ6_WHEAT|nr:CASP-like protein 3A1 isoform X2 [Triticum aestivum]XP_044349947.1 CASP-like protein 3A1 isoform X2 [Triticum aestivum]KAF7030605.1 hypothetical protein CFC21_042118 [Triticum aestivum]
MGSFANGQNGSELGIQMPAMGSSAVLEPPTTSVTPRCPRLDMAMVATRAAALVMALLSMSLMVSARQRGNLIIFGIEIPLYAKWSLSDSLKSLVGISAAAAAYSLAQLLSIAYKALKKVPAVPSRRYAWMLLAGDQIESPVHRRLTARLCPSIGSWPPQLSSVQISCDLQCLVVRASLIAWARRWGIFNAR